MKKIYKKPMVEIVAFELNESVAGNCALDVYTHALGNTSCELTDIGNDIAFGEKVTFTVDHDCKGGNVLDDYCYFTYAENDGNKGLVFAS